jgi:CheY-like chemotaxis protein
MPRILVVDDEPAIRQLLRTVLEEAGYEVMEAGNGEEAVRLAGGTSIDLVVTDLVMPDKEGIELIQYFRKSLPDVKMIALSGVGYSQYLRMAQMLGAHAVFEKPFATEDLLKTVEKPALPLSGHPPSRPNDARVQALADVSGC